MFKLINKYSDIIVSFKIQRFEHFGDILEGGEKGSHLFFPLDN